MNSGPELVSEDSAVDAAGTEVTVTVIRHWGVRYNPADPSAVRWDPGYGSGVYVPYNEAEARADAVRCGGVVVTRTETTVVTLTRWEVAP